MTVTFSDAAIRGAIRRAVAQGVVAAAEAVRSEAVSLILDSAKTGRVYHRRSVDHQASAPGEPPASDTGRLVSSIRTNYRNGGLVATISASTAYAAYLEYGTRKMAPRPFMRPALANKREEVEELLASSVQRALAVLGVRR